MTDTNGIELVRKAGKRLSLVVQKVAVECQATGGQPCEEVLDGALNSINHQGLHADWNLIRAMVGVDPT